VYFGGAYAVSFYYILSDGWKNLRDRFSSSKHLCQQNFVSVNLERIQIWKYCLEEVMFRHRSSAYKTLLPKPTML